MNPLEMDEIKARTELWQKLTLLSQAVIDCLFAVVQLAQAEMKKK